MNITINTFVWSPLDVDETGDKSCIYTDLREQSAWRTAKCNVSNQYVICENTTTTTVAGNGKYVHVRVYMTYTIMHNRIGTLIKETNPCEQWHH